MIRSNAKKSNSEELDNGVIRMTDGEPTTDLRSVLKYPLCDPRLAANTNGMISTIGS